MEIMKYFGKGLAGLAIVTAALLMTGCQTDNADGKYSYDPLAQPNGAQPQASGNSSTMIASTAPMAPAAPVDATQTMLQKGDTVTFNFTDTKDPIMPMEDIVKEDGTVMLMYNQKFEAEGKTIGTLQQEIHDWYVPKYFKYLTVNIKTQERFYYVGGEVRQPNRQIYSGAMDVLKAIDTAGGFTEFARKSKVQVTRSNGEIFFVDCTRALKHPEENKKVFPGDKIQVSKRIW
jgi:polysaccharide export outer membrane protein